MKIKVINFNFIFIDIFLIMGRFCHYISFLKFKVNGIRKSVIKNVVN